MITCLPHRTVHPYIDTSTQGPGTLQPAPLPDCGPLDGRRTKAIDNLLGNVSDAIRKRMQNIMQPLPTGELEALYRHGLRFDITEKPSYMQRAMSAATGLQMLGGYNEGTRQIQFMEKTLMGSLGPHMVIHEMSHAIDHMRGLRLPGSGASSLGRFGPSPMESARDHEIRSLYHRYQARANVEDVDTMRNEVQIANDMKKPLPEHARIVSDFDHWGYRPVDYDRNNGMETFHIEPTMRARNKRLAHVAIGAALMGGGLALPAVLGPAAIAVGGIMVGLAAIGQVRSIMHDRAAPRTEVDVELRSPHGAKAHVVQQDERAVVTLPDGARSFTGDTWSDYAHRGNMGEEKRGVGEYVAEAYSTYLEGGDKAKLFRDNDPDMYHFVELRLRDEFNRNA